MDSPRVEATSKANLPTQWPHRIIDEHGNIVEDLDETDSEDLLPSPI